MSRDKRTISDVLETLDELQRKMFQTPALNGGFDKLTEKVGKIEDRVEMIHDRMFDPDEGVFARIKDVETSKADDVDRLEKEVIELRIWRDNEEKTFQRDAHLANERAQVIKQLEEQVKTLTSLKDRLTTILKWIVLAAASGSATILGKLAYDFVKIRFQIN